MGAQASQKTLLKIIAFVVLQSSVLGEDEAAYKRSEFSRQVLPKWMANIDDSEVPSWMKITASEYRGYPDQVVCAVRKMAKAYNDMRATRFKNCDSYFHCRGSYEAAKCGVYASTVAGHISHHTNWQFGGVDNNYDAGAVVFGLSGGNCLNEYKYKTFGTQNECNLPWYYHRR